MKTFKFGKKIISLSIIFILVIIVSFALIMSLFNNAEITVTDKELGNIEKIISVLPSVKPNTDSLSEASDVNGELPVKRTIKRYTTLKDIDGDSDYLYTEFNEGGYAIYDRIGEFLYERSDFGEGPYSNVFESKDIYYGGPSYYYIKKSNDFFELQNSRKAPNQELKQLTLGIEEVRQQYLDGDTTTLSINDVSTMAAVQTYNLGEGIKDDELSYATQWYFLTFAMMLNYGFDQGATLQVYGDNVEVPLDTVCGLNKFGSCTTVALVLLLKYYDDLGFADMIPDDISNFNLMYDYKFRSSNENLIKYFNLIDKIEAINGKYYYNIWLNNVDKNLLRTERLHQELLSHAFPQYRGKNLDYFNSLPNPDSTFGLYISDCGNVYNIYANAHGLKNYKFNQRNGVEQVPENIIAGNPCILHLDKSTPELTELKNPADHAVLCYAFTGKKVLWWYDTYEVYCNFGWQDKPERGSVVVNKEFVKYNVSAEIL